MLSSWSSWVKRSLPQPSVFDWSAARDVSDDHFAEDSLSDEPRLNDIHPDSTVTDIMEINPSALLCLLEYHSGDDTFCGFRGEETLRDIGERTGVSVRRIVVELRLALVKS